MRADASTRGAGNTLSTMNTYIAPGILIILLQQDGGGGGSIGSFLPMMILIFGIFYFLVIRPQQKKQKQAQRERDDLLSALKSNDKVITSGGIYGTIVAVRETTVQLRIAQGVSIEVLRSAIAGPQSAESKEVEAAKS
jgi:preprotein translocase subunit YajC